jgi:predicted nucleic acid-binding Zn ribbon protein
MPGYRYFKRDKSDLTDAVGDIIVREKRRKSVALQAKIVGWLIVVLVIISLVLIISVKVAE